MKPAPPDEFAADVVRQVHDEDRLSWAPVLADNRSEGRSHLFGHLRGHVPKPVVASQLDDVSGAEDERAERDEPRLSQRGVERPDQQEAREGAREIDEAFAVCGDDANRERQDWRHREK